MNQRTKQNLITLAFVLPFLIIPILGVIGMNNPDSAIVSYADKVLSALFSKSGMFLIIAVVILALIIYFIHRAKFSREFQLKFNFKKENLGFLLPTILIGSYNGREFFTIKEKTFVFLKLDRSANITKRALEKMFNKKELYLVRVKWILKLLVEIWARSRYHAYQNTKDIEMKFLLIFQSPYFKDMPIESTNNQIKSVIVERIGTYDDGENKFLVCFFSETTKNVQHYTEVLDYLINTAGSTENNFSAPNQQLMDYIKQSRQSGLTDEQIKKSLLDAGWGEEDVGEVLKKTVFGKIMDNVI